MPFQAQDEVNRQKRDLEEQYERMFAKIGRDFVTREDMQTFIDALTGFLNTLLPDSADLSITQSGAKSLAKEYKKNLDRGKNIADKYEDLVEFDSDEEETE